MKICCLDLRGFCLNVDLLSIKMTCLPLGIPHVQTIVEKDNVLYSSVLSAHLVCLNICIHSITI